MLSRILRLHSDLVEENLKFISDTIISIFLLLAEIYYLLTLSRHCLKHFTEYEPDNNHYLPFTDGLEVKQSARAASLYCTCLSAAQSTPWSLHLLPADLWDL